ncbi:FAD-dependent oxidoreductase [Agrococcus sp. BE272]|uniref:NAD(P)/FAD-dependent oxidoreductase n=1 Tax=Agrococcus sp. BE272 TaxID=2817727 RepID=UPI00285BDEEB|nr:FAD-dependent oxidoreductase [Agrococcus sp. BE272]MDR7232954.1 NADPH-dependent 2,4-dienoyl-CoA reductase/sulfur reductase-like enzyme [Agrococcus sp. BE272]
MASEQRHDVLIIGGGNGGLSAAAHLLRRGCRDVALIEPAEQHVYKPLQHYLGTGIASERELSRPQASLIPDGVRWYRSAAVAVDPERRAVRCADGTEVRGADLIVAPGARIDWSRLPGAERALAEGTAVTTFVDDLLPRTRQRLDALDRGRAVFQVHEQPASGRETAFKPLLISCDRWRARGVLDRIEVVLVHEGARLHPVAAIEAEIRRHLDDYGIDVRLGTRIRSIDGDAVELEGPAGETTLQADLLHLHPPYAAPAFLAESGLDDASSGGFAAVDPETLRHRRHPRVWAVGDGADLGDARTGGALREQVKTVVENIRRSRAGQPLERYDGYTVAPIATARRSLSFGEYDRALRVRRSLPVPDEIRSRLVWHVLDRYGLPQVYWHRILKGRL